MPGYNVESPAAAFSNTLEEAMLHREALKHQAKVEEQQAKLAQAHLEMEQKRLELEQRSEEGREADRKAVLAERVQTREENEAVKTAAGLMPGDILDAQSQKLLQKHLPSSVRMVPPTVPGTSIPLERESVTPEPMQFRGTPAQRTEVERTAAEKKIEESLPEGSPERKALEYQRVTGKNAPAGVFKLAGATEMVPVMEINPRTHKVEQIGDAPKGSHFITEPKPTQVTVNTGVPATSIPGWSKEAIDMESKNRAKGGPLPAFGMMGKGEKTLALGVIENRAAQFDVEQNKFIDDPTYKHDPDKPITTPDLATNKAVIHANTVALAKITTQEAGIKAYSYAYKHNADLLRDVLKDIPDLKSTWLNKPLRSIATGIAAKDQNRFNVFVASIQAESNRLINNPNLTGVMSDSSRRELQSIVDGSAPISGIRETLDAIQEEIANREEGIAKEKKALKAELQGGPAPVEPPAKSKYSVTVR